MIELKHVSIFNDNHTYVKDLSFTLNPKDKLAIIGEEGNGKSTLLKSILGIAPYVKVEGKIKINGKIGYLAQSLEESLLSLVVKDYIFNDEIDYYNKINALYHYVNLLNINETLMYQVLGTLSGGEKVKVALLQILLDNPDILFLDEPTNDLDIETLRWLENFIITCDKPIIYVSHDETLLSRTANAILHLEQIKKKQSCRHTYIKIDYDTYVEKRLRAIQHQTQIARSERREYKEKEERLRQVMQRVEHEQRTISRQDPHGGQLLKKKMRALKSQERRLDNTTITEMPDVEEGINFFFVDTYVPSSKVILDLKLDELRVDHKILAKDIKLEVIGNTHLCIIGNNGTGKTTLIKIIYNLLKDRNDIKVGYMPQNYLDIFKDYTYVLDFIAPSKKKEDITRARTYLGNMKFTKEEMVGKISDLSNGSKAKLFLSKFTLDKYDVLILDEPTRNVSPLSNPIIRKALSEFTGCIISVSHDRKYLDEVIDDLYYLDKNGLHKIYDY